MSLDNCIRCGRMFQKQLSSICGDCLLYAQNLNKEIYRFIQDKPSGVTMEEIAEEFKLKLKDVEQLVFSGALGTANQLIRTQCARCKCEMTFVNQIGYFCYTCNKSIEREIGKISESEQKIENILKGRPSLSKEEATELKQAVADSKRQQQKASEQSAQDKNQTYSAKYGFKRISNRSTSRGLKKSP